MTLDGYSQCLQAVLDIGRPTLVLGGGGFNQINTARAWCRATAMICEAELAEELPPHDFVEYYLPESTLAVLTVEMTNKNTAETIQATLDECMQAHAHVHAHVHMRTCTCTHAHMHTCTHAHMHTCTRAHVHTCTRAHMHMHTCTHAHVHTCTCT